MKTLRFVSRIIVGLVFIFSGFVKAVDPLGSMYKFHDYFLAFGMEWLSPAALWLGIILCLLEFVIGTALIFNVRMKLAAWGVMLFMAFFTVLTFYLALTNPVSDCGCFGDAIIMTNWQTFYKNVIIMIFTLVIFFGRKAYMQCKSCIYHNAVIAISSAVLLGTVYYSYYHLPILDFLPWKVGNKIQELVIPTPEVAEITLIYKHKETGELLEYTTKNLPYNDSILWNNIEFVEQKKTIITPYIAPPITDFMIRDTLNDDYTEEIISNPGFQFLLVTYNVNYAHVDNFTKINEFVDSCYSNNISFVGLTGSAHEDADIIINKASIKYPVYFVDETTLKSVVRSNPGMVLLFNGVVVDKWAYRDFPSWTKFLSAKDGYIAFAEKVNAENAKENKLD